MKNIHENIIIGVNLSLIGGFLDAYTYILKDGVFANAQTGNLVLLFIAFVNGAFTDILTFSIPIIMFASGILISELFKNLFKDHKNNLRVKLTLLIEVIIILIVAIFGKNLPHATVNSIISFLAAIQVNSFDKVQGVPIATTMITGNLKSSMININMYHLTKDKTYKTKFITYIIIILFFGIGVTIGTILVKHFGDYAILTCIIFIFISYLVIKNEEKLNY